MRLIKGKYNDKGFTLVELIVVLVILAVLAAILIPALLGYIEEAKKNQDKLDTKNLLTATQSKLTYLYSRDKFDDPDQHCVLKNLTSSDCAQYQYNVKRTTRTQDIFNEILDAVDEKPALFVVGLGQYDVYAKGQTRGISTSITKNPHIAYTVLYAVYKRDKNSKTQFFNGEVWTEKNPLGNNSGQYYGRNKITINGTIYYLQYYEIANDKTLGNGDFWNLWNN